MPTQVDFSKWPTDASCWDIKNVFFNDSHKIEGAIPGQTLFISGVSGSFISHVRRNRSFSISGKEIIIDKINRY